jgi:hypothetical protein
MNKWFSKSYVLSQFRKMARRLVMEKFKIPTIPHTTSKSIRFPDTIIEDVERVIIGKDCTFSAFVVEAVRIALINVEESESESEYKKDI